MQAHWTAHVISLQDHTSAAFLQLFVASVDGFARQSRSFLSRSALFSRACKIQWVPLRNLGRSNPEHVES